MRLRSCLSKLRPIRLAPASSIFPTRSFSADISQVLYKQEKSVNLSSFSHDVLNDYKMDSTDPSKVQLTKKFGKETVSVEFKVGDMTLIQGDLHASSTPETLAASGINTNIDGEATYFFQVTLSKPGLGTNLNFVVSTTESNDDLSIVTLQVDRESSGYELEFSDFDPFVQKSLSEYLNERVGENMGQFVTRYYNLKEENLYQTWLKDMQNYVA